MSQINRTPQPQLPGGTSASRRAFMQKAAGAAAGAAALGLIPAVHAAEDNAIRLALIGCGGRGSGAAANALSAPGGPVKLTAMADLFEKRLTSSHAALFEQFGPKVEVPAERRFIGFDAFRRAIDTLRPGDVAMLCGYAGWRPVQLEYAVSRGVHAFMEKSFACDVPGLKRIVAAGEQAEKKNLKIAAGLMCRHSPAREQLIGRIRAGELGDVNLVRVYRMESVGPLGVKPPTERELDWQIRNFTKFYWVSGGLFAEMTIHQIDEICWIKDALPISAHGIGGRAPNSRDPAQNLDAYSIEYTFADGARATVGVRYVPNCHAEFATYVHGTKCAAQFSGAIHAATVRQYRGQKMEKDQIAWQPPADPDTSWQLEWNDFLESIRRDRPHNEAKRAAMSNVADIMARAAVHSGQVVTWDEAWNSKFQWCPGLDQMTFETPPPVALDASGKYPIPSPGAWQEL